MKESSHRSSSFTVAFRVIIITLVVLVCLTVFGRYIGSAVSFVTTPIYSFTEWFRQSAAPLPSYVRSRTELLDEVNALKEALSAQSGSEATIARLSAENEELRALFSPSEEIRIASGIIARPPYVPYDSLLIDRGSSDGITEGAVVFYAHDQTIGFVSRVFRQSALVTLFSAHNAEGTAYIYGPNIFVDMYGEGGGIIRLSVPQGVVVEVGDPVVLPGLGMGIVGVVSEVRSIPTEPEQQAYVAFSVPIQALHTVSVSGRTIERVSYADAEKLLSEWDYHALGIDIPLVSPEGSTTTLETNVRE